MMKAVIDSSLYKSLSVVLIISIVITLAFNLYMRERIRESEGFSELYINDHRDLPRDMVIGETYNITFTFTNHEINPETYTYEVDSQLINYSRQIRLAVGETAQVTVSVTPKQGPWGVTMYSVTQTRNILATTQNSTMPIQSFNVSGFGEILHENITLQEIAAKPLSRYVSEYTQDSNSTQQRQANYTIKTDGESITLEKTEEITNTINIPRPFIMKVYKAGDKKGEELEVHFWYQVN